MKQFTTIDHSAEAREPWASSCETHLGAFPNLYVSTPIM
jgi:hypothetical protein